ncbi:ATP-binding cassette domain-containing protein [Nocardioides gansuensis]|uniref:ATP-binding cassette domain-containing protein n=1 Tax=Nocardioides gansuensis TaxID=2138300 RepID=UPI00147853B0|nr:ATP-binding cassette domain-containing protein [Nocardioides gansuensis]
MTGVRIEAEALCRRTPSGRAVLQDVCLTIQPGELVVIAGGSGAGKTTLLEALAGLAALDRGQVHFDGIDAHREAPRFRTMLGYVPQDDIVHEELPLERTLRFSAALRLPGASPAEVDDAVARSMAELNLTDHAATRVAALSGGQRKRASLAVELLTGPRVFFLDEPTSGLDPATGADLLALLRRLADEGSTVVLTSHAVQDLAAADRLVFLAPGGRLAFSGTASQALDYFGVDRLEQIYQRIATERSPEVWGTRWAAERAATTPGRPQPPASTPPAVRPPAGPLRQWQVLTRRTAATLLHNRLTMAILLGSPAMVVAMFAVLFKPAAFDATDPSPTAVIMIVFWIAFGVFFFGLTYGLLQICTEFAILRRERLVGLRLGPYILAKTAVLLPFLVLVDVLMLAVLRVLDRLPEAGLATYGSLTVTLALNAAAALALGLLASAVVPSPSQATLILPMLCFPAVLFSGAIVPVPVMAWAGRAMSVLMPDRWAFEAIGVDLGVRTLFAEGGSPLGPPLLAAYGDTGSREVSTYWLILTVFAVVFTVATWVVLARRTRTLTR